MFPDHILYLWCWMIRRYRYRTGINIPHGTYSIIQKKFNCRGWNLMGRVADPIHFRQDPDPSNQNFKNRIRILLALIKNQFKHLKKFASYQSDFFKYFLCMLFFYLKKWKNSHEYLKKLPFFILSFFIQLCRARVPRFRIRRKRSGSGSATVHNGYLWWRSAGLSGLSPEEFCPFSTVSSPLQASFSPPRAPETGFCTSGRTHTPASHLEVFFTFFYFQLQAETWSRKSCETVCPFNLHTF